MRMSSRQRRRCTDDCTSPKMIKNLMVLSVGTNICASKKARPTSFSSTHSYTYSLLPPIMPGFGPWICTCIIFVYM